MSRSATLLLLMTQFLCARTAIAQTIQKDDASRAERLVFLTERAHEYQLFVDRDRAVRMTMQPVFRWSHPVAKLEDAAVFLWMEEGQPVALGTMILHSELGLFTELQSVTSKNLKAVKNRDTVWEPAQKGCQFSPVPNASKPADTATERLTQMKMLSRRFEAQLTKAPPFYSEGSTWQLRLLPKQLVRYGSPTGTAIDGAMFVFCHDTDPELILLLEASGEVNDTAWQFAFAPLTGWEAKVKCDEKVVWSQPRLQSVTNPKLTYIKFGPDPVTTKTRSQEESK